MAAAAVSVSLVSASLVSSAPSSRKLPVARFNGLKAVPLLRHRAVVSRSAAIRRIAICAAAKPETLSAVQGIIAEKLSLTVEKVSPEAKFVDLGADSLDTVEIIMALEETFKIDLDEDGAQKITTVQEAADLIQSTITALPSVKKT